MGGCACFEGREAEKCHRGPAAAKPETVTSLLRITETVDITAVEPETASVATDAFFAPESSRAESGDLPNPFSPPPLTTGAAMSNARGENDLAVMTSEDIFDLCTDTLVNSTVAKVCGRFFTGDIMKVMDICTAGELKR